MPDKKKILSEVTDPTLLQAKEISSDDGLSGRIADVESDGGDYTALNPHTKALGKYQFVPSYHWKDIQKVTGVKTYNEFLHKPEAQENFFLWHKEHNLKPAVSSLHDVNKDGYDDDQLARLVHFKGPEGARKWLAGHVDDTTDNNISIDKYIGKPKGVSGLKEVTDPTLLQAEEISTQQQQPNPLAPIPQKQLTVEDGLAKMDPITGLPITGPQQQAQPAAGPAADNNAPQNEWNTPHATIDAGGPVQGVTVSSTGKADLSLRAKAPKTEAPITADQIRAQTADASKFLADDILQNTSNLPPEYAHNISNVPFTEPGNIVHDITNPTGNPEMTAGYMKTRSAQMAKDHEQERQRAMSSMRNDPNADMDALGKADADYFGKQNKLRESASHIIDLQLANQAQTNKKFDPILLGIQKQKLLGDKRAAQDEIAYNSKRPLDPNAKFSYQSIGYNILQNAKNSTAANGQEAVAQQFGEHSDNAQQRLEKDNPEIFKKERIQSIANAIYKKENPIYGTIFSRQSVSQEELEAAAKELGYSKSQIKDIKPDDIPRSAGMLNQAVQGLFNTAGAPLYEGGMRALAGLGIANQDAVNERFHPGWEDESGFGNAITGETPHAQHELSMSNPRGVLGTMSKGVGDLFGFLASAEGATGILKGTGLVKNIEKAHKIANFATAALPSYNSAYQHSMEVIGDDPADESKRQLYSITNGIIGGAVMMIDPQANIARDIMGETKAGKDLISMIKNKDLGELTHPELREKLTQVLTETTKHLGLQVAIPVIQTAATNLTDMIVDPEHPHGLTDNTGDAAIHGAVAMFLPSLFAGIHAPANQSRMNKALMWEVGTNSRQFRTQVTDLYKQGKLTRDESLMAIKNIDKVSSIIKGQLPVNSLVTGKELTPDQKQEYAWSLLKTDDLQGKLEAAESTKDNAQISQVKGMISGEEKLRADILNKAGDAPKGEKATLKQTTEPGLSQQTNRPKTISERDPKIIAHEAVQEVLKENAEKNKQPEEPAAAKENPEDANKSEENVSLSPDNTESLSTTKTESNETISRGHEGESNPTATESENSRQNTDVRQAESLEGSQDGKNGLLEQQPVKPVADKESGGTANKQSPPEPISGKRKRRFVEEDEGAKPAEAKTEPAPASRKVTIDNIDKVMTDGAGRLEISADGEKVPFKTFDVAIDHDNKTAEVAFVQKLDPTKNKGVGYDAYVELGNRLAEKGITLESKGQAQYEPGRKLWDRLVKDGHAKGSNGRYEFIPKEKAPAIEDIHSEKLKEHNQIGKEWVEAKREADELDQASENAPDSVPLKKASEEAAVKAEKLQEKLTGAQKELAEVKDKMPSKEKTSKANKKSEPAKAKEAPIDIIHTPKGSFVKLSDNVKPGSVVRVEKGGRMRTYRVTESPVKRGANKDLIGRHRVKEITNAPRFDFQAYNSKVNELKDFEPQTLEEATLMHLLAGGKFIKGTEQIPGIEKHIGTRKGSAENVNAHNNYLAENGTKEDALNRKADKFGYEFNDQETHNEGIIGEVLSNYRTKSDMVNRLHEIMQERKAAEEGNNPNDATISFKHVDPETGEVENIDFDATDPDLDHKLAKYMGIPEEEAPVSFTEEGHPIYELGLQNEAAISDHPLSEQESDQLYKIWERVTDENGKVNEDMLFNEADALLRDENTSPALKKLLEDIVPFPHKDQNTPFIEKIRNLVSEYEQSKDRNAEGKTSEATEGSASERSIEDTQQGESGEDRPDPGDGEEEFNAHESRIKEIDLELQKQRASQKLEHEKGKSATATGDIEAINKHKDNWFKKQDRIDKLNAEKAELQRKIDMREREAELKGGYKAVAQSLRDYGAKMIEGSRGMLGSFPLLNPKLAGKLIQHIGDFVEKLGNIHAAIYRGIEKFRTEHPEEKLSLDHIQEIKDFVDWMVPPQEKAPVLNLANEEAAKDILADVQSGKISYTDALAEVMQEEISDKAKGKILNYLDWHLRDQEIHNTETLREPENESKYLNDYSLTGSGETSRYLSGDTLSDVHGQDVQFDIDSKETQLQKNIVQDSANIVGLAKHHSGSNDPLVFGGDMLSQLSKIPDGGENSVKKVLAITGLNNELHAERVRLQDEITNLPATDTQRRTEIATRLTDLNKMISQVELKYRDITSNASDVLNAARANRIFRNTYFHDLYADKILSEEQRAAKQSREEALTKSEVSDTIAEEGPMQEKEVAEKTVEQIVQDKEKSAAGKDVAKDVTGKTDKRKSAEKPKDKKKGVIDRLKDIGKGKKEKSEKAEGEKRKETMTKEQAEKKANEYLGGSTVEDLFQKAKEQTKKPC